jgi:hypothetical protein
MATWSLQAPYRIAERADKIDLQRAQPKRIRPPPKSGAGEEHASSPTPPQGPQKLLQAYRAPMVNSSSTAREASHQVWRAGHLLRPNRQEYRKARSLTELARNLNAAGVQIDHHLDEMETNARADDSRHVAAAMITLE